MLFRSEFEASVGKVFDKKLFKPVKNFYNLTNIELRRKKFRRKKLK